MTNKTKNKEINSGLKVSFDRGDIWHTIQYAMTVFKFNGHLTHEQAMIKTLEMCRIIEPPINRKTDNEYVIDVLTEKISYLNRILTDGSINYPAATRKELTHEAITLQREIDKLS